MLSDIFKPRSQAAVAPEMVFQPRCGMLVAQVVVKASGGRKNKDRTINAINTVLAITYTTVKTACCPAVIHTPTMMAESDKFVFVIASSGSDKAIHRIGLAAEAMAQLRQSHRSICEGKARFQPAMWMAPRTTDRRIVGIHVSDFHFEVPPLLRSGPLSFTIFAAEGQAPSLRSGKMIVLLTARDFLNNTA